ncbi:hypothetical protein ACMFMG_005290 [Clarireedia jacksonii]
MAEVVNTTGSFLSPGNSSSSSRGFIDDPQEYLLSNLYTVVIPTVVIFGILLHNWTTNKFNNHGYPSIGSLGFWEPTFLLRLRFVWGAVDMLKDGYYKFKDQAFWIRRNDIDILVLPVRFVDEIRNYTREQLSGIEALAYNVLGEYTGIDILVKSDLHVKVLRNYLTPNMGKVMLNARDELDYSQEVDIPACEDWQEVDIQNIMRWIVARISARTFIGYPACRNDAWIQTSLDYSRDVFTIAFFVHWFPRWLHGIIIPLMPARRRLDKHTEFARKVLEPAIKRWDDAVAGGVEEGEPFTLLNGMLKSAKGEERNADQIVDRQLISSLASIHTSVMTATYCLLELCQHPEYIEPLLEEAKEGMAEDPDWARNSNSRMPKIDSFICEISRIHPPSTLLPQRKAREAVTLSNGIHVPEGTHFAFPLGPVVRDPERFPDPEKFDGMRYYNRRKEEGLSMSSGKYLATTPSEEHLVFGHGQQACPGRFFAVNEVKLIMVFFLLNYDMRQPEKQKGSRLHFSFEEYFILNPTLRLELKKKI